MSGSMIAMHCLLSARSGALALMLAFSQPAPGGGPNGPGIVTQNPGRPPYLAAGYASWYGHPFHGRRTANGERYDMMELTAAHKTIPFGTLVRVTNLRNNRSVVVRINDRGPYIGARLLDLSLAAAMEIDMVHKGVEKVRIEEIHFFDARPAK